MKGRKKTPKVPGFTRHVVGANVRALMDLHYREHSNKPMALAKAAGISLSSVQRVLLAKTGPSVDTIEMIAAAFQMSCYQLLIPNLHADNPQVVHGATKDEERLYRRWMQYAKGAGVDTGKFFPFDQSAKK